MLQATVGLLISVGGGVLAAALVPSAKAAGWLPLDCPGCQISNDPSTNPGPGIVLDFTFVTKIAGSCVENTDTTDPNDCKPSGKCKLGGTLGITNNLADPPKWQVNNSSTGTSKPLPGNGAFTALPLAGSEFVCGGNANFTVTRSDGTPGTQATWSWNCPACPLDAD